MSILPVLDSRPDVLSLDWPEGRYRCTMTPVRGGQAITADHLVEGADALATLVTSGSARFAVEIVSPVTFTSFLELAPEGSSSHTFDLDPSRVAKDGAQARPGLVAVVDCKLHATQLSPAWQSLRSDVEVRAGQWLARDQHAELTSPQMSLLRFLPDRALNRHEMRCRYAHPGYDILMNPDLLTECQQNEGSPAAKTVILAAFVSALADAGQQSAFIGSEGEDEKEKESIGHQLDAKLKALDPDCPAPGEDDYDPLRAATILLQDGDVFTFNSEEDQS